MNNCMCAYSVLVSMGGWVMGGIFVCVFEYVIFITSFLYICPVSCMAAGGCRCSGGSSEKTYLVSEADVGRILRIECQALLNDGSTLAGR